MACDKEHPQISSSYKRSLDLVVFAISGNTVIREALDGYEEYRSAITGGEESQ